MKMWPLLIGRSSCHWGRAGLGDRQPHPEGAAVARLGHRAYLSTHHVHHPLCDREAEPEPLLGKRFASPVEALEDPLDLVRRDPRSGVGYLDHHFAVLLAAAA